jgi:hypothetical protein
MQPVFFILEEFHLFASHPRQSLLYNLFDMTQQSSMQVRPRVFSDTMYVLTLLTLGSIHGGVYDTYVFVRTGDEACRQSSSSLLRAM